MELCPTFSFSFASGASVSVYVKWVEYLRGLALGVVLCGHHHAVEGVTWGSVTLGRLLPAFIPRTYLFFQRSKENGDQRQLLCGTTLRMLRTLD